MTMQPLAPMLAAWLDAGDAVIIARIVRAIGSTPREKGATMLISRARAFGSIGGGQLEFHAIDRARAMIAAGETMRDLDLPLGPHLGQCCGGRVVVALARATIDDIDALHRLDVASETQAPQVLLFGAGHTGRALARQLALLPLRAALIDDRDGVFDGLPANVTTRRIDDPADAVADARPGAAFVVLTHSHALDYRLADAALRRGDAAYVGMIGSATKRAQFERWFLQREGSRAMLARLTCPIGGAGVADKRPEIIAALTIADIARALFSARAASAQDEKFDGRAA